MPRSKYPGIHTRGFPEWNDVPFSLDYLREASRPRKVMGAIMRALIWPISWLLLRFFPVVRMFDFVLLTRADDVRAVLNDPAQFPMPFGPEMEALGRNATFLLGLDGEPQERQKRIVMSAYRPGDVARMEEQALIFAQALLDAGKGEIDVAQDLIRRVLTENAIRLFGIGPVDPDDLANWVMACSNMLFADPFGDAKARDMGMAASGRINALIDYRVNTLIRGGIAACGDTLLERLVKAHLNDPIKGPSRPEIRAMMLGLLVGSVPTTTLGGGRILEELSKRPQARADMVTAAKAYLMDGSAHGKGARRMEAILQELLRLNPTIGPVMFRWSPGEAWVMRKEGPPIRIAAQSTILLSTRTALRDPRETRRPDHYDPDRQDRAEFVFGAHPHACIGEAMAIAQLRAIFAALMAREGASESMGALKIKHIGPYPLQALIRYRYDDNSQMGVFIAIPAPQGVVAEIDAAIDAAAADMPQLRPELDATEMIHFLSITAAPICRKGGEVGDTEAMIFVEINADGDGTEAIYAVGRIMEKQLRAIFFAAHLPPESDIGIMLERNRERLRGTPWGATSLQYYGRKEVSVVEIGRQDKVATYAAERLQHVFRKQLGLIASASAALREVRSDVATDRALPRWMAPYLLKPSSQRMAISVWPGKASFGQVAFQPPLPMVWAGLALTVIAIGFALPTILTMHSPGVLRNGVGFLWLFGQAVGVLLLALLAILAVAIVLLRWHEIHDKEDKERPSVEHLQAIAACEDLPGHAQNHIFAVTPLKRGLFRQLSLAASLWGIQLTLLQRFRPGFVSTMGTIHFARWVRLPGRNTMIFQSNYDGSWESYLEDFITRVHQGQTAAWSHTEGFPRSEFLTRNGAQDGDNFKFYVRCKQLPTRFWYARFPHLSNDQIRRNALIHDGLCRASTETEARRWLALFGSAQPTPGTIESHEVQSLLFSGYGKLRYATTLLLRFEGDAENAKLWLGTLSGFQNDEGISTLDAPAGKRSSADCIAFGEEERWGTAVNLALTAHGLRHLGLPDGAPNLGMNALPGPFHMGMAARGRRLGDEGEEHPDKWSWSDGGDEPVHAALFLYALSEERLAELRRFHIGDAGRRGIRLVAEVATLPQPGGDHIKEHFGFRDGMAQPVIAGTIRAAKPHAPQDLVPAGEMIIGYANAQGFLTPGIPLSPRDDPMNRLPEMPAKPDRFPRFGANAAGEPNRDFGRNGAFVAIRMLEQNVVDFRDATEAIAQRITASYPHLDSVLGVKVTREWVQARMVGRWHDGAPLLGNSRDPGRKWRERPMAFGTDDPAGYQCPLGAHVRRANPRDSLQPGDEVEQGIVNRHRMIRRGRSYEMEGKKGLMFVAICEDLERQFEFVQRTWLDSNGFHGLAQNDPLIGRCPANETRTFDIPTPGGTILATGLPQFVYVRAGGYFFLPSRSAIMWLAGV